MNKQRGYYYNGDLFVGLLVCAGLGGGFVIYVAIPWLWQVAIKPALLWVLT